MEMKTIETRATNMDNERANDKVTRITTIIYCVHSSTNMVSMMTVVSIVTIRARTWSINSVKCSITIGSQIDD
jgi:hypothetical protein